MRQFRPDVVKTAFAGSAADDMDASPEATAAVQPGALYVVATPIGNLDDFSPRARASLAGVDGIAAADTRTTSVLLAHCGIQRPLIALHEHNEDRVTVQLVDDLKSGRALALVSDAGTPLISDPGYALVREVRAAGLRVFAVPGPCAAIAALSISGLATDRFVFAGFLPSKTTARRARFEDFLLEPRTIVVYESAHRIGESLADLVAVLGARRRVSLSRELSKRFEESITATAIEVRDWQAADVNRSRGEFVLVIEGAVKTGEDLVDAERVLRLLLAELPASRAARLAAEITGVSRKRLYDIASRERKDDPEPDP